MTTTDEKQPNPAASALHASPDAIADVLCKYAMDNPALPKGTQQRIAKQAADLLNNSNSQLSCN
jgi:hypothetical protein